MSGRCAICGRPAHDLHHVHQKGMGGVSAEVDAAIPRLRLCGSGNLDGCHGLVHAKRLHIHEIDGGWAFWVSAEPMKDATAWREHGDEFLPVPFGEEGQ